MTGLIVLALLVLADDFQDGLLAMQRNDWKAAETHLEAAAKAAPANARVWVALARTRAKLDRTTDAATAAGKAATLGASDAIVQKSLALHYATSSQPLEAARAQARYAALSKTAEARDEATAMYFALVQPLLTQQKFAEAITILDQAEVKDSAQLELARGVAYYGTRHFNDAATAFLNTIRIAPEIEQPYLFLGKFLDQIGPRLPEITKTFEAYEKTHPDRDTGYLLHAKALNAQNLEPDLAWRLVTEALARNDRNASAHFELGSILFRRQRYEEAAKAWEKSAELDPRNAAVHYRLSLVYRRLGKPEAAEAARALHARYEKDLEAGKYQ